MISKRCTLLWYVGPVMEYACIIWGDATKYATERSYELRKHAARLILDIKRPTEVNTENLFHELHWMTVYQRVQYHSAIMAYKCINNMASEQLNNILMTVNTVHSRTRQPVHNDLFYKNVDFL